MTSALFDDIKAVERFPAAAIARAVPAKERDGYARRALWHEHNPHKRRTRKAHRSS